MKESSKDVENAVILVGKSLKIDEMVVKLLLHNVGIYSTVKEIIYKAFVQNKMDYFEKDDNVYKSYQIIRRYCNEIDENGEIKFGE